MWLRQFSPEIANHIGDRQLSTGDQNRDPRRTVSSSLPPSEHHVSKCGSRAIIGAVA
jgi:hypothetical protein